MRVTFNSQWQEAAIALDRASERLLDAQRRVASGRRVDKISDDPTASATAVSERSNLAKVEQYTRAADSTTSRLSVVDGALSDIIEQLTTVRTTAAGAAGDTATAGQRIALGQQLRSLRDGLVDGFNTSFRGVYVFAGAASTTKPYVVPGGGTIPAYVGSNTAVQLEVGDGRVATIGIDGATISRGSDAQDVFQTLDALITAVEAGDDNGILTGINGVQRAFDRATAAQTRVAADMQAVDAEKLQLQQTHLTVEERLSRLEDVNMADAITKLSQADAAYRASLGAVSNIARLTLMDYLK